MLGFTSSFTRALGVPACRPLGCSHTARACSTNGKPQASPTTESELSGARESRFEIISQERIFHRYQSVYARTVRYPTGQTVSYDVIGNACSDFTSVFVFPFDRGTQSVTLLREYSPGRNRETPSFVAGMFESDKHSSVEAAARAELSEEALLKGGELERLTIGGGGVAADKYSLNEFHFYLGLDARPDEQPGRRDEEEWIEVERGVPLEEVRRMVLDGELDTPNSLLAMLSLARLRELGFE